MDAQNFPRHFFIADDDEDDREIFSEMLIELSGSIVLSRFSNGAELIDRLNQGIGPLPEVIFLDLRMPLKNGFECLAEIRKFPVPIGKLSIVIFSSADQQSIIANAFDLGATFYAIKPNSFLDLKALLTEIIQMDWSSPTVQQDKLSSYLISPT